MRNGNKYHIKPTGNQGDDPGLSRSDRFADDFEREAFEGLDRHPGWKRDVNEMKSVFRRKWGIPMLPVYVRFSMYTLATAVCLVFVFIISEKWYGLKDDMQQKQLADETTVGQKPVTGDTIVSLVPAEQKQSETHATVADRSVSQAISDKENRSTANIMVKNEDGDVSRSAENFSEVSAETITTNSETPVKDQTVLDDIKTSTKEVAKKTDKAGQGEGVMLGGNAATEREKAEEKAMSGKQESATGWNDLPQSTAYKSYPQDYMYELTVVDYTQIRTTNDIDGLAYLSGVDARYENKDESKTVNKVMEESPAQQQIPYVDFLRNAMKKFKGKMYGAALADYETILKTYPDDLNALFYGGISNYHLKRNDRALLYLDKVISDKTEVFFPEAEWYKALTLIQADRKNEARQLLRKIADEGGFYSEKAVKKLGELR